MIVDDSVAICKTLQRLLDKEYEVSTAQNGKIAVEMVCTTPPDLILMDVMMPEMDGITATKVIRENYQKTFLPIIMLSAAGEKEKWTEALNAGANDFVPKPFHQSELLARIKTHLQIAELTNKLTRKNAQMEDEKILARKVQESILPHNLDFSGMEIETFYRACSQIGGDFFDVWERNSVIHFLIGDVSGHGTASALLMAAWKGVLYSLGQSVLTPLETVTVANRLIYEMVSDNGMYLTLAYVVFDKNTKELQVISAGHPPLYLVHKQQIQRIPATGMALGWFPQADWEVKRFPFEKGDLLFFYTDGVTEAQNSEGKMFGGNRLQALLRQHSEDPRQLVRSIIQTVEQFCDKKFEDDVTLMVIKKE